MHNEIVMIFDIDGLLFTEIEEAELIWCDSYHPVVEGCGASYSIRVCDSDA